MTVDEAATLKGVAPNTIYRLLRDDDRRHRIFPKAISVGEGRRKVWVLDEDEVVAWQPAATKPGTLKDMFASIHHINEGMVVGTANLGNHPHEFPEFNYGYVCIREDKTYQRVFLFEDALKIMSTPGFVRCVHIYTTPRNGHIEDNLISRKNPTSAEGEAGDDDPF